MTIQHTESIPAIPAILRYLTVTKEFLASIHPFFVEGDGQRLALCFSCDFCGVLAANPCKTPSGRQVYPHFLRIQDAWYRANIWVGRETLLARIAFLESNNYQESLLYG